jgi:pyridoxamine 5'-phosphate oxidase
VSSEYESLSGLVDTEFPAYSDPPSDPVTLAQEWVRDAEAAGVREPRSLVLSTADLTPELTSRVVATLGFEDGAVLFATHSCSRKIRDLAQVPAACGLFYWPELGRQLSLAGPVRQLPRTRAETLWHKRPVPLHSMSTVSRQSEQLTSPEELLKLAQELEGSGPLPCPEQFALYALDPTSVEFWAASSDRLHRRLRCEKGRSGWTSLRLQP